MSKASRLRYRDDPANCGLDCGSEFKSQMPVNPRLNNGGRYRIRIYDFHRVNLYRFGFSTYKCAETA